MTLDRRRTIFGLALVAMTLIFLEGSLALLARVSSRVRHVLASPWVSATIPDARLGHRPNPDYPGYDARGFRNAEALDTAQIVALGDSQTFGVGVTAAQAWPSQLRDISGKTVYSMAYGGIGPAHELVFWDEVAALRPTIVVEATYAGNDYFDAFDLVYNRGQLPELVSPDASVRESVREAERAAPLADRIAKLFVMDAEVAPEQGWTVGAESGGFSPRRWITAHSSLFGLLRRGRYELSRAAKERRAPAGDPWEAAKAFAEAHPRFCRAFDDGRVRTVFTSDYRLSAVDQDDPRIREGLHVCMRALRVMKERADASGIRLLVVRIPTKETVFAEVVPDPSESHARLVANERMAAHAMETFLAENGIEQLDALPALREQLARGPQPYPVTHDGHPNEHGQRAIARLVADLLATAAPP